MVGGAQHGAGPRGPAGDPIVVFDADGRYLRSNPRVRRRIAADLASLGIASRSDRLGNLIATIEGNAELPSVMLIAHMDQLGLIVRKIEANGLIRAERVGGVPERALAAQEGVEAELARRVQGGDDIVSPLADADERAIETALRVFEQRPDLEVSVRQRTVLAIDEYE